MITGPFNFFHVGKLKELLETQNIEHKFMADPDTQEIITEKNMAETPRSRPTYKSSGDFLYLEIDDQHLPLIKQELERLGAVINTDSGELDHSDYLCAQCDYSAHEPGLCPEHKTQLLEFSDWVKKSSDSDSRSGKIITWAVIALILAAVLYTRMK